MTVAVWTVILDPSAAIEDRTELNLNNGPISVTNEGIDWGEAQIKAYLAEQEWGEAPVSFRVPNRIVTIPFGLGMSSGPNAETEYEEARKKIQQKVGQLQREGGVLLRQRSDGDPMYADIVNATAVIPDVYGETGFVEPNGHLTLECLPDFYGEEVELKKLEVKEPNTFEPNTWSHVLEKAVEENAVIEGDYPARTIIKLTGKATTSFKGLIWAVRSKNYSSAATAATYLPPSNLTLLNSAKRETTGSEYYGTAVNLPSAIYSDWTAMCSTDLATGGPCTHVGSYQVWARMSSSNNSGAEVRLVWSLDDATAPTYNEAQSIPTEETGYLLNLGVINIPKAPVGEHWWRGYIQVKNRIASEIACDGIWLQCLDEAAGILRATKTNLPSPSLVQRVTSTQKSEDDSSFGSGHVWTDPAHLGEGIKPHAIIATGNENSVALFAKKFGLALPSGAEIHGIETIIGYEWFTREVYGAWGELTTKLVREGTVASSTFTNIFSPYQGAGTFTHGGPNELWGETWTYSEANAESTGIVLIAKTLENELAISSAELRVYYTLAETTLAEDAVIYDDKEAQIRWDGCFREDDSSGAFVAVSREQGNLIRLPPSGLEERPVELLLRPSPGNLENEPDKKPTSTTYLAFTPLYAPTWIGRL